MMFKTLSTFTGLTLLTFSLTGCNANTNSTSSEFKKQPNVLIVVADDLGYTDLGSFGGEISTPNLDAIAKDGTRFTNFYTAPTCSPTRAMLLTGAENHKVGLGAMAEIIAPNQNGHTGYEGYLNYSATFLPNTFKKAGYNTMMAGKWHLGYKEDQSPFARGFEQTYALLDGGAGHFTNLGIDVKEAKFRENGKLTSIPDDFYSSKFYTSKMMQFIENKRSSNKPFFGYLTFTAPHWPLQAPDDSIAKYKGKYQQGYDELHNQRIVNAKDLGMIQKELTEIPAPTGLQKWDELTPDEQKIMQRKMEIYAAMVDDMDKQFGRLITYLKETGEYDNTIIFFMSDNGAEGASLEREFKYIFAPHANACCDNSYNNLGKADSYVLYGPMWARASVGSARHYKGSTLEGGIKSPAFIHFPAMKQLGKINNQFIHVKDVIPTLLDLVGIPIPSNADVKVEGTSIYGERSVPDIGWELHGNKAYRYGDWKIVKLYNRANPTNGHWQLFNLANDPGEQHDLIKSKPKKFAELLAKWDVYQKENRIIDPIYKSGTNH